ncbi:sorbitol dehydrogenase [Formosimonas limnophila]|uniref:Sorbitol dehydrogenase n=1 Tax=Formosimonas limnophila TaxID=1384487 RepID=A0A8J3CMJ0_9BURK|nr:L-iditol 2-dehydrogenase [Formosimonas limnophila]GHA68831.1 sorbitol dehydrogenase [Formosimonas limnophila]
MKLQGKHAILTGAAGGIGLAVAQAYLHEGAKCTILDINEQAPDELKSIMAQYPNQLVYQRADVTKTSELPHVVSRAEGIFGPVHILFNNAAVFDLAPLLESTEASYDKLFSVNVKGMFFMMQAVLASMVKNQIKGAVINMCSQAGRRGEALVSHYCATKAAVLSYTQSAALAMAEHHIRVNGIAPGVIDTPMWVHVDAMFAKYENLAIGEKKKQVGLAVPLGYMGTPSDIVGAAVFLASDDSSYITAQTLNVDGGSVMS